MAISKWLNKCTPHFQEALHRTSCLRPLPFRWSLYGRKRTGDAHKIAFHATEQRIIVVRNRYSDVQPEACNCTHPASSTRTWLISLINVFINITSHATSYDRLHNMHALLHGIYHRTFPSLCRITVIPRLRKIIRSGITFVSRNSNVNNPVGLVGLPYVMWSAHFFVTHIQTENISSWNGPTVHVSARIH